jgi:LPS export ABC transporter protein LptC
MDLKDKDSNTKALALIQGLWPLLLLTAILYLGSCKNDIEQINALTNNLNLPNQSGKNYEVQFTDSGKMQLKFNAPLVVRYLKKEGGPYYEFPAGIEVIFYDKDSKPESKVTAGYAKYFEEKNLWEARDSVVARNLNTLERLETEQLFWNMDKKIVYSEVFTKITNPDGVYYGEKGFEATQDMKKYKLIGSSGSVNVKNEEVE